MLLSAGYVEALRVFGRNQVSWEGIVSVLALLVVYVWVKRRARL